MFDRLRWRWTYEPDLQAGMVIPDFLMDFSRPCIVECKPATTTEECESYREILIDKMPEWLSVDVAREIRLLKNDPLGSPEALRSAQQDLGRVDAGQNPRGYTRRILVVGSQLHLRGERLTVDGDHAFCLCTGAGEPDHVGLAYEGQHCLVCGLDVESWMPAEPLVDAWRSVGADQQWKAKRRRR